MKKCLIILGCFILSAFSLSAVHAMNNNSEIAHHITMESNDESEFLGEWKFCEGTKCYLRKLPVYQKGRNLYVYSGYQYYRLIPCDKDGYNYYFSNQDGTWYTKI